MGNLPSKAKELFRNGVTAKSETTNLDQMVEELGVIAGLKLACIGLTLPERVRIYSFTLSYAFLVSTFDFSMISKTRYDQSLCPLRPASGKHKFFKEPFLLQVVLLSVFE